VHSGWPFLGTVAPWAFHPSEWSASHQATGWSQPIGLGCGELGSLCEECSGVEVAVRCAEWGAGIDDTGNSGSGGVDHPAELFDTFDELRQHVRLDVGRPDRAERIDRCDGCGDRCSDSVAVLFGDRVVGVGGGEPGEWWHRAGKRSHCYPPRVEVLDAARRRRRIRSEAVPGRGSRCSGSSRSSRSSRTGSVHAPMMTRGVSQSCARKHSSAFTCSSRSRGVARGTVQQIATTVVR